MKNILTTFLLAAIIASCTSTSRNIFSKKTPHEVYAEKLDDNDLDKTPEGRQWLAASKMALENTQSIQLPYRQQGYFAPDKARALGLNFTAKRGEKLSFSFKKKSPFVMYADLFKKGGEGPSLLASADTGALEFSYNIEETGSYILRLQPELFKTGEYNLSISVGPSLNFPVGNNKGEVGSFWGASRDGGKRRHEGVDIFAPRRTPVVAAADAVVTAVKEEGIGGKTVWLRMEKNLSLYYAHLDKQLVQQGQLVKKGDVVGLVGNTGNAKHTASHLHFGIYTYAGPTDPLPFVNKVVRTAPFMAEKNLSGLLRLKKTQTPEGRETIKINTVLVPIAVTSSGYISELPDGKLIKLPFTSVEFVATPAKKDVAANAQKREKRS